MGASNALILRVHCSPAIIPGMARTVHRTAGLSIILAAALLIRLALAPWTAHPGDLPELSAWADALAAHGWVGLYAASSANYPPLGTLYAGAILTSLAIFSGVVRDQLEFILDKVGG